MRGDSPHSSLSSAVEAVDGGARLVKLQQMLGGFVVDVDGQVSGQIAHCVQMVSSQIGIS